MRPGAIGPFRVERELGRGGMGEVYLARDTRLDRLVAIKALPAHVAQDPDRLARFQREAKVLASLNHPGIGAIYGVEEASGHQYLILEYVEGETLAERLARGALALDEALPLARQMAEALEMAHEKGVIHRDFKPGNVMVTPDGLAKVLDFGLARTTERAEASSQAGAVSALPTVTSPVPAHSPTVPGVIMGSAGYMSPEQARGKGVDERSDVFSFGCVLYEMLTGVMPFRGETVADSLGATLHKEAEWSLLPAATPGPVRDLLESCLAKDRKNRLQDIGDARLAIDRAMKGGVPTFVAAGRTVRRELTAWLALGLMVVVAGVLVLTLKQGRDREVKAAPLARLAFVAPANVVMEQWAQMKVSPDGTKLLFAARGPGAGRQLWLRRLDSLEAQPLPDTEDAVEWFWSPDSKSIGFGSKGKLRRLDLGAARAQVLCDVARLVGGSWGRSGIILFAPDWRAPIYQIPAEGGTPKVVVKPDPERNEEGCRGPCFLPDGRHFVYHAAGGTPGVTVKLGSIDSDASTVLLPATGGSAAAYVPPGWLLTVRNGVPCAQAFDPDTRTLSGDIIPIGSAPSDEDAGGVGMSASDNGVLVLSYYRWFDYELKWFDRAGKELGSLGGVIKTGGDISPELSPDGSQLVMQRIDRVTRNSDLWLIDVAKDTLTRLTTGPTYEQAPAWSADGSFVYYSSGGGSRGPGGMYRIAATGGAEELIDDDGFRLPRQASPDGRFLIFSERGEKTRLDLWMLPLTPTGEAAGKAVPLLNSEFEECMPALSPDGRMLAYVSDVDGLADVYVRPISPDGKLGKAVRVSTGGGTQPRWKGDSKELYYVAGLMSVPEGEMMAARVKEGAKDLDFEPATPLFKTRMITNTISTTYAVTKDGTRFLVGTVVGERIPPKILIVTNWKEMLVARDTPNAGRR